MNAKIRVRLMDDAREAYLTLKDQLDNKFNLTLFDSINSKIDVLKINCSAGIQIKKSRIPKKYLSEYAVTNLWKINLSNYWRMVYTIRQNQRTEEIDVLEIFLEILDIIDHSKYNKVFGYKKK
jgi:hypothetical protein